MIKKTTRKTIINHLGTMTKEALAANSQTACQMLCETVEFNNSRNVMFFLSLPNEIDTGTALKMAFELNKTVLVPHVDWEEWVIEPYIMPSLDCPIERGKYGLKSLKNGIAADIGDIDMIVVPGVGFDEQGYRLGRGGGFYDRFLSDSRRRAITCGLALEQQIVDEVPREEHDMPVDMLVTEKSIRRFGKMRQ